MGDLSVYRVDEIVNESSISVLRKQSCKASKIVFPWSRSALTRGKNGQR